MLTCSQVLVFQLIKLKDKSSQNLFQPYPSNCTEKGDVKVKTEALKKVIFLILNGEKLPGLLMTIIRFVLPLQVLRAFSTLFNRSFSWLF